VTVGPLAPDTQALVEALERVSTLPGTGELFDALTAEDAPGVARALGAFPRHPRARAVAVWLAARGIEGPERPGAEAVMAAHGIEDLEAHLLGAQQQLTTVQRSLDAALSRASRAESVASAYAAVLVLVVGLAGLGWAAALGVIPLFAPPAAPEKPAHEPAPTPSSTSAHGAGEGAR